MTRRLSAAARTSILDRFRSITVWQQGGQRAPNKPLLLLYTLARLSRGESCEVDYHEIDKRLRSLLLEFGPVRKSVHPEYPFWRLQNDGLWIVSDAEHLEPRKGKDDPKKSELMRLNPIGRFTPDVEAAFKADRTLLAEVVGQILETSFPENLHDDILSEVGMQLQEVVTRRLVRDPAFREKVMRAYERRCAVCGFDVRLGSQSLALEAAHIKWHQAGGPDIETNGLALCSLHHKLLDRGAFTLSPERTVLVSQDVNGSAGLDEILLRHHGAALRAPQSDGYLADPQFIAWHGREVFRKPPRI